MEKRKESSSDSKRTVILISCSKAKASRRCQAKDMYLGTLFKKSVIYSRLKKTSFFILSAKYGLLHPNTSIDPYDLSLNHMNRIDRSKWADKVKIQMEDFGITQSKKILLAGEKYVEFIEGDRPLKGLSQGYQLQWLNKQISDLSFKINFSMRLR